MWCQANQIPKDVYEAFVVLKRNTQFIAFAKWLEEGQTEENSGFPFIHDDVDLRVSQGRAQVVNAILNAIENAEEIVQKFKGKVV